MKEQISRREFLKKSLEGIIVGSIPLISSCERNLVNPNSKCAELKSQNILILDDLYNDSITNYVNQRIFLKTKIKWEYCSLKYPEDPRPFAEIQRRICSPHPTVVFDNIDKYIERKRYSNPGNFFIISDKLIKIRDSNGKEQYSFNGNILSNDDKFYILEGLLKYRERLNITEDKLNNPKFIKQSNNPTYWSQTFAFELVAIYK